MSGVNDIRKASSTTSRATATSVVASLAAGAAQRPHADVHQCRHGAVQERLHRPREAPLCARHHLAEMRARRRQAQRPRQCRLHRAPSHLLRDARQFLVRRLFQGTRDRARLEPDHQGIRPAEGPPAGHRLYRRRRGLRPVEEDRRPARQQDPAHRRLGQFLGDGRHRPLRSVLGNLLRPRRAHPRRPAGQRRTRMATASSRSGISSSCSTSSFAAGERVEPAAAVDRHRHGARAHRRRAAGHARQLRHRSVRDADRAPRRPDRRRRRTARRRPRTASSPTICARRRS